MAGKDKLETAKKVVNTAGTVLAAASAIAAILGKKK